MTVARGRTSSPSAAAGAPLPPEPADPDEPLLWVRSCQDCGGVDHLSAWGSPAVVAPGPWGCRFCPSTAWVLRRLSTTGP